MEVEVWFQGQYEVAAQARPSKHGCSELHVDLSDLPGLSRFGLLDCRAKQLASSVLSNLTFRASQPFH